MLFLMATRIEIPKDHIGDANKMVAFPKPTKKKKKSQAYWKRKSDRVIGEIIHLGLDFGYPCCLIGETAGKHRLEGAMYSCAGRLEFDHMISRSRLSTRHAIENGILLCSLHHKFSRLLSHHTAPLEFASFLQEYWPEKWEWVQAQKNKTEKAPDFEQVFKRLEMELKGRKNEIKSY